MLVTRGAGAHGALPISSRRASVSVRTAAVPPRVADRQQGFSDASDATSRRGALLGLVASIAVVVGPASQARADVTTMKRKESGVLSEVEQRVEQLVMEEEAALELQLAELELEREQEGKLCVTPFGVDIVGISETIALAGALVGGLAAGKRKKEVDKLNDQLRKINMQLRQQARAGTMFAPGLTYAPVSSLAPGASGAVAVAPVRPPVVVKPTTTRTPSGTMVSVSMEEDEMSADQIACRDALKTGKGMLKEKNGPGAMVRFEKALMISKALGDKIQERRACRGLAAASRLNKQHATAIKYLERVLEVSREMQEYTGDADAFGTIADCYTDMGEFEKAAQFYDKYIAAMG